MTWHITDGVITLRPSTLEDTSTLIAGRDPEWARWLAPGSPSPQPSACILVKEEIVGWIDFETGHEWLKPGEVNIGYNIFAAHRRRGYATRALKLLLHRLALEARYQGAVLMIHPENMRSIAVASRGGFIYCGQKEPDDHFTHSMDLFVQAIPPLTYSDGVVTIRQQSLSDLEADLAAKDQEQIRWLWMPGEKEPWEAMSAEQQRAHAQRGLQQNIASFGAGPKWIFSVDAGESRYVAYIDCDLANNHAPPGEANISYSCHPEHRGKGYVARAVRLLQRFLWEHTGARGAHLIIDQRNKASLRIAHKLGAIEEERFLNERGSLMLRHVLSIGQ